MLGNFAAHCITMDGCIWCTLANMTCGIECTVLRSTFVLQGQLYVDKVDCSTHRAVNCDDSHQRWKLAGTLGLFSQRGRSERPVPNVPADINALILRGRCGRPMCETQGGGTKCGRKSIQRTLTKQPCRQRTNIYVRITSSRPVPQRRTKSAAVVGFSVSRAPRAARLILSSSLQTSAISLDKGVLHNTPTC